VFSVEKDFFQECFMKYAPRGCTAKSGLALADVPDMFPETGNRNWKGTRNRAKGIDNFKDGNVY
jgi:hypothetical protein